MKKSLLAVVAALAMAGCSQNDLVDEIDNGGQISKAEIGFSSVVGKNSRAAAMVTSDLQTQGFNVYAYNTGETSKGALAITFIENAAITYDKEKREWGSQNIFYWPATDYLQFFAYSSKKTGLTLTAATTDTYPTLAYTVADTEANQEDLLVAQVADKKKTDAKVSFEFTHALTQINFSAQGDIEGLTYKVTSITLNNIANEGNYKYADNSWGDQTGTATYTILSEEKAISTTATNINNGAYMLLPQTLGATATITVKYTVVDGKNQMIKDASAGENITISGKWDPNKNIRYTLSLTSDATPIGWDATVNSGWGTEAPGTVVPAPGE